jgi:hypothetical protein
MAKNMWNTYILYCTAYTHTHLISTIDIYDTGRAAHNTVSETLVAET